MNKRSNLTARFGRAIIAGAAVLLLSTGCAASAPKDADKDSGAESGQVNEEARALLPEMIRDSGKLKVATSLTWAPFDYKDENGKPAGLEIEMMDAIGEVLGVEIQVTDIDWQSLVPSVSNNRFDIAMNQLEDTPDRRKEVQFIHYYKDAIAVLTKKGVELDPEHLCGAQIAVTQGSSQQTTVGRLSEECVAAGEKPIDAQVFSESASTILAVQNGRAESMLMGRAGGVYLQKTDASDLQVSEGYVPDTEALTGFVIKKDNDELAKAIQAALEALSKDDRYQELMADYGVSSGALTEFTIGKG